MTHGPAMMGTHDRTQAVCGGAVDPVTSEPPIQRVLAHQRVWEVSASISDFVHRGALETCVAHTFGEPSMLGDEGRGCLSRIVGGCKKDGEPPHHRDGQAVPLPAVLDLGAGATRRRDAPLLPWNPRRAGQAESTPPCPATSPTRTAGAHSKDRLRRRRENCQPCRIGCLSWTPHRHRCRRKDPNMVLGPPQPNLIPLNECRQQNPRRGGEHCEPNLFSGVILRWRNTLTGCTADATRPEGAAGVSA